MASSQIWTSSLYKTKHACPNLIWPYLLGYINVLCILAYKSKLVFIFMLDLKLHTLLHVIQWYKMCENKNNSPKLP